MTLPPYSAELGDAKAGEAVFKTYCSRCHGDRRNGRPRKGGSVIDPALLSLDKRPVPPDDGDRRPLRPGHVQIGEAIRPGTP